jgi:glycosyltransferase involved in cell wall biosynthesis
MNSPLVSIVIANYNRTALLQNTLLSIQKSSYENYEVIVVDDGSHDQGSVIALGKRFPQTTVHPLIKHGINPCTAYNVGFSKAKGDIVIVQNAECKHVGDIIRHAVTWCNDNNYLVYSCLNTGTLEGQEMFSWYNHPEYNPKLLHFCSAITRKNLKPFDPDYANGLCFDDDDWLRNINFGQNLDIINVPPLQCFVIHQSHLSVNYNDAFSQTLIDVNRKLFHVKHTDMLDRIKKSILEGTYNWSIVVNGVRFFLNSFRTQTFSLTVPRIAYTAESAKIVYNEEVSLDSDICLSFTTSTSYARVSVNGIIFSRGEPIIVPYQSTINVDLDQKYVVSDIVIKKA